MAEQACYTLIHPGEQSGMPNEQQLKHDLGEDNEILK